MSIPTMARHVSEYLPNITSISGILFYSFLAYILTYGLSYLRVRVVNNYLDKESQRGSAKIREAIIKKREEKTKAAQELAKALSE